MDQDLKPLVSVVTPVHNAGRYIKQAIESTLAQTYRPLELIMVDDGSTDNGPSVMQEFASNPKVKIIRHATNAGIITARQTAINHATGDYIAVLDADDYWPDHDKLAKQIAFLNTHLDYSLVGSNADLVDQSGNKKDILKYPERDKTIRQQLLIRNCFVHSSIMFRREAYQRVGGYLASERDGVEDYGLILRLGRQSKLANLPDITTAYRVNPTGISQRQRRQQIINSLNLVKKNHDSYPNYYLGWLKWQLQLLLT